MNSSQYLSASLCSAFLCSLFLFAVPARAADETGPLGYGMPGFRAELISDRPDFTESTETIEPGHLQAEMGYTFTDNDNDSSHSFPELLLRIGLTSHSEFRLGGDGYVIFDEEEADREGVSDLTVGIKLALSQETDLLPATSVMLDLGLPTGDSEVTADRVEPAVHVLFSRDLNERISVGSNLNFAARADGEEHYFEFSPTVSVGAAISDEIATFVEFFGIYPAANAAAEDQSYADFGFTYLITADLQLDARIGFGLNDSAGGLFTGAGFAFRL